jgi:ASC-1-like (ASCH) protein
VKHHLKTDPVPFDDVADGFKRFEIRTDDREPRFAVGDILVLHRTDHTGAAMAAGAPLVYSGQVVEVKVIHILRGPIYGLAAGWVIMSIELRAT